MNIIYSDEYLPPFYKDTLINNEHELITNINSIYSNGIFLCGPTPRDKKTISWRKEAIKLFEKYNSNITLFIPERKDWSVKFDYYDQINWELTAISRVEKIMFWVPRNLENMPGFTTNVEFGYTIGLDEKNIYYGRPHNAPKIKYMDYLYNLYFEREIFNDLEEMVKEICTNVK